MHTKNGIAKRGIAFAFQYTTLSALEIYLNHVPHGMVSQRKRKTESESVQPKNIPRLSKTMQHSKFICPLPVHLFHNVHSLQVQS